MGFLVPAAVATAIVLATLSLFRWLELRSPTQLYARLAIRFPRAARVGEPELRSALTERGFGIADTSHRLLDDGATYEFQMVIHTLKRDDLSDLAEHLCAWDAVREFELGQAAE